MTAFYIKPDGLKVYLSWHGRRAVESVDELENILKEYNIIYGIDHKALEIMALEYRMINSEEVCEHNILVAKGKPPKHGKDGYYEWKFQVGRKYFPKLKADGAIDFDALKWFEYVKKGDVLAVYHFAETATDGMNVFGKKIPAKIGKEKECLKGKGFVLLPDLRTYVADEDGNVCLKNKELIVEKILELPHIK